LAVSFFVTFLLFLLAIFFLSVLAAEDLTAVADFTFFYFDFDAF